MLSIHLSIYLSITNDILSFPNLFFHSYQFFFLPDFPIFKISFTNSPSLSLSLSYSSLFLFSFYHFVLLFCFHVILFNSFFFFSNYSIFIALLSLSLSLSLSLWSSLTTIRTTSSSLHHYRHPYLPISLSLRPWPLFRRAAAAAARLVKMAVYFILQINQTNPNFEKKLSHSKSTS